MTILLDMAHQSLHLMRPDEALSLAGFGLAVESNSPGTQDSGHARARAVNLAGLAGSHARAGDVDAAVNFGRHALEEISRTSSVRAYQRLRLLDNCLAVHQIADVADLRHDIHTACAAS